MPPRQPRTHLQHIVILGPHSERNLLDDGQEFHHVLIREVVQLGAVVWESSLRTSASERKRGGISVDGSLHLGMTRA